LDLQVSREILENSVLVYESGLTLQEVQQYNLGLQKAELALQTAKDDLMRTEISAPFDSTVADINIAIDDQLSTVDYSSTTAVKLLDTTTVKFEGIVDEIDIFKVKTGQKAVIFIDALPDTEFTGVVTFISPFGSSATGVVTFTVIIELDPVDIDLKEGLTATADILLADKKDVLLLPTEAVLATPMGTGVVVLNEETGERKMRKVTIGAQNYNVTEIISGLNEDETVIIIDKKTLEAAKSQGAPPGSMRPPGGSGSSGSNRPSGGSVPAGHP
jgi:HlyD family secretion protein